MLQALSSFLENASIVSGEQCVDNEKIHCPLVLVVVQFTCTGVSCRVYLVHCMI